MGAAVTDAAAGYVYFGTGTAPGQIVKVRVSDFTRVGTLTLAAGENYVYAGAIDSAAGYAYFGTNTSPGRVVILASMRAKCSSNLRRCDRKY